MLKKLALYLTKRKDAFYELSYRTGATKVDSWIDIEGGFGNLFANASLRKLFPNQPFQQTLLLDGLPIDSQTTMESINNDRLPDRAHFPLFKSQNDRMVTYKLDCPSGPQELAFFTTPSTPRKIVSVSMRLSQ